MKNLIFIGPLPDPVNGQSLVTEELLQEFGVRNLNLFVIDTSSYFNGAVIDKLYRVVVHFKAVIGVMFRPGNVYLSLNSNFGMWLSFIIVLFSVIRRKRIAVHHHAYAHITKHSLSMRLISWLPSRFIVHFVLASSMRDSFKLRYGAHLSVRVLNNSNIIPCEYHPVLKSDSNVITVGHMSNLSKEKGCIAVIDAVIHARKKGYDCKLILAGPIGDDSIKEAIHTATEYLGMYFEYIGPVYGDDKKKFYDEIDLFLFPSTYSNEAEPLVMLESLASGVPVVAFDVGCIGEDLDFGGGVAVNIHANFSRAVVSYLDAFTSNKIEYSVRARQRFEQLLNTNNQQFGALCDFLGC